MEEKIKKILNKILDIFIYEGYGISEYDKETYEIVDRTIIDKAKIGSIKVLTDGTISIKLYGEIKKQSKFKEIMDNISYKIKPISNIATAGKIVRNMINSYKKAKKVIYKENYNELLKEYDKKYDITKNELEKTINTYLVENKDREEYNKLLKYVSRQFGIDPNVCEAKFGDILDITLHFNEELYNKKMNIIFEKEDIKNDFRKFLKEKVENIEDKINNDKALTLLRNTRNYKLSDEEAKYRILWKYVIRTYGDKFQKSEDLESICRNIAAKDEETF